MKRTFTKLLLLVTACLTLAGCGKNATTSSIIGGSDGPTSIIVGETTTPAPVDLLSGKHYVEITIKDKGTISVELDANIAPITVTNFVNLAKSGFYDGLTFHRIIDGFMMQGGAPVSTESSAATIKGEFASNGIENPLEHTRGTISMARSAKPDSANSQFFIVQEDSPWLNGDYAAFGHVTEGMEIVDDICKNAIVEDGNGTVLPENRPIIESIIVVEKE